MFKDTEGHETQYCESCLDLQKKLEAKEQLSVKQSHELIRLRKERQENKQKNVNLLQKNEELEKQLENEKQALDEIEKILDNSTADTETNNAKWLHGYYLARYCEIRNVINGIKE